MYPTNICLSTQPQKLTQPPSFAPDNFEYINSDSSFDNTGSVSNNVGN